MNKKKVLEEILINIGYKDKNHSLNKLLTVISKEKYSLTELGLCKSATTKFGYRNFPNKPKGIKICTYLLEKYGMQWCSKCKEVHFIEVFSKNKAKRTGLNSWCKLAFRNYQKEEPLKWRAYAAKRKAALLKRIPKWANFQIIEEIYKKCPIAYEVDHIIPLQGKLVSGLHVENNLQYLTKEENKIKSNHLEV